MSSRPCMVANDDQSQEGRQGGMEIDALLSALDADDADAPGGGPGPNLGAMDDDDDGDGNDDDMSDGDAGAAARPAAAAAEEALRRRPRAVQIAARKAKIARLRAEMQQLLEEEDFMGAQAVKESIHGQEAELAAVRNQLCAAAPAAASVAASAKAAGDVDTSNADAGPEREGSKDPASAEKQAGALLWRESAAPDAVELVGDDQPHPFALPRSVFERLFEYQQDGVAWLAKLWLKQQGGILADEMGLGKTVQICALLNGARKSGATHALVLLPVTLLDQWAGEARLWCPGWPIYTYYGSAAQREQALRGIGLPQGGVLLTSYSMLSNSEQLFEVMICEQRKRKTGKRARPRKKRRGDRAEDVDEVADDDPWEEAELPPTELPRPGESRAWDLVICDEAHRMKNISSLFSKSLRRLRSRCRLLLTGTPVQNALQDLWALMDFAQPGLLGNHATFVKQFSDPIDRGSVRGAGPFAVTLKNHLAQQLRGLMAPHMLRRTKVNSGLLVEEESTSAGVTVTTDDFGDLDGAQFKALPLKRETIVWLIPSEEQMIIYKKVLEKSEIVREAAEKSKLGIEVFRAIGLLKRLCNHPLLVLPMSKPGAWREVLGEATDSLPETTPDDRVEPSDATEDNLAEAGLSGGAAGQVSDDARAGRAAEMMARRLLRDADSLLAQSAKLRCMALLLPALASRGHRILVFSQSVKMLDLVQICVLKPHGLRCLRIDGQTEPAVRAEKVAKFQEQPERFQCMLLTTGVGGVGLNLTGADRVIMVDPAWNPATDAQAVDRAYRIGQTREVRVYRLITSGLIEDKMFRLQVYKLGLTKTALEDKKQNHVFTAREIRALFEWTDPAEGETRKLLTAERGNVDAAVLEAANDDGAERDGWLGDWLAAGASDFAEFTQNLSEEQGGSDLAEKRVTEAKQKLESAEERTQQADKAHQALEEKRCAAEKGIVEATTAISSFAVARAQAEEAIRERRALVKQARNAEAAHQKLAQRTISEQLQASEAHARASHGQKQQELAATQAQKVAEEARGAARTAEAGASKAYESAAAILGGSTWNEDGQAQGIGLCAAVDVVPEKMIRAQRALELVGAALSKTAGRQSEVEDVEDEFFAFNMGLLQADSASGDAGVAAGASGTSEKEREQVRRQLERAQERHALQAEAAREATSKAVAALLDVGLAFVDCFEKTAQRPTRTEEVKVAQASVRSTLRQLSASWSVSRKAQESWLKAAAGRSKAAQRHAAAAAAAAVAGTALASAERAGAEATRNLEARIEACRLAEQALAEAQQARDKAEADEALLKQQREQLKGEAAFARNELKPAKAAVKEAAAERQKVVAQFARMEKAQMRAEAAKHSALERLKSEKYDASQVEQAYELKKKGTLALLADPEEDPGSPDAKRKAASPREEGDCAAGCSPAKRPRAEGRAKKTSPTGRGGG